MATPRAISLQPGSRFFVWLVAIVFYDTFAPGELRNAFARRDGADLDRASHFSARQTQPTGNAANRRTASARGFPGQPDRARWFANDLSEFRTRAGIETAASPDAPRLAA